MRRPIVPLVGLAAALWNEASGTEDLRVDTSTAGFASFSEALAAHERGEDLAPVGGVLVVSGEASGLASPATEGADDGEIAARLWWAPSCALAFGVVRIPDLSGMPLWVSIPAALHAVGHALGLAHSEDPVSVMAAAPLPPNARDECPERREDPNAVCIAQGITPDDADVVRAGRW